MEESERGTIWEGIGAKGERSGESKFCPRLSRFREFRFTHVEGGFAWPEGARLDICFQHVRSIRVRALGADGLHYGSAGAPGGIEAKAKRSWPLAIGIVLRSHVRRGYGYGANGYLSVWVLRFRRKDPGMRDFSGWKQ